jgi:hypothetical protein
MSLIDNIDLFVAVDRIVAQHNAVPPEKEVVPHLSFVDLHLKMVKLFMAGRKPRQKKRKANCTLKMRPAGH